MSFDDCCGDNNGIEVKGDALVYSPYLQCLIWTESDECSGNDDCVRLQKAKSRRMAFLPLFDIFKWAALEVTRRRVEQNTPKTLPQSLHRSQFGSTIR